MARLVFMAAAIALAAALLMPSSPRVVIRYDLGGPVVDRMVEIDALGSERIEIRGLCASACTLYLGAPGVCVARSARLIFHAPHRDGAPMPDAAFWTAVMADHYPPVMARWFLEEVIPAGGDHTLTGREAVAMGAPQC